MVAVINGPGRNFILEVAKGNIPGHELVIIAGKNPDVDSAAEETIWTAGALEAFPTAARIHDIVSTAAADAAAGTGARTVRIKGLDSGFIRIEEDISLNGTTNVPTVNSYLRVNDFQVLTAGSGEENAGTITATAQTDATVSAEIAIGENQSQAMIYTIPDAKTGFLRSALASVLKAQTSSADFTMMVRPSGGVFLPSVPISVNSQGSSFLQAFVDGAFSFPARSDVVVRASVSANNVGVSGALTVMLVDD